MAELAARTVPAFEAAHIHPASLAAAIALTHAADATSSAASSSCIPSLFASAAVLSVVKPSLWPGPVGSTTSAQIGYDAEGLLVLWRCAAPFARARDDPLDKKTILGDSRVEIFIAACDHDTTTASDHAPTSYHGYEMNRAGRVLDFSVTSPRQFDFEWSGNARLLATWTELPPNDDGEGDVRMLMRVPFADFCTPDQRNAIQRLADDVTPESESTATDSTPAAPSFHLGVYRGEAHPVDAAGNSTGHIWQSAVDPLSPRVDFHVPQTFGLLRLRAPELTDVTLVSPGLFQGSLLSLAPATLLRYGITHVLNAAAGECRTLEYLFLEDSLAADLFNVPRSASAGSRTGGQRQQQEVGEGPPLNLIDAYRFMVEAIRDGGRVLVHCAQGKSRSSAIVLLYLIKLRDVHVDRALRDLRALRPVAQPNARFLEQLRNYCRQEEITEGQGD